MIFIIMFLTVELILFNHLNNFCWDTRCYSISRYVMSHNRISPNDCIVTYINIWHNTNSYTTHNTVVFTDDYNIVFTLVNTFVNAAVITGVSTFVCMVVWVFVLVK